SRCRGTIALRHEIDFPFARQTAFIVFMKEVKPKSRGKTKGRPTRKDPGGDTLYSKPALRSDAFVRALTEAKACLKNPDDLQALDGFMVWETTSAGGAL